MFILFLYSSELIYRNNNIVESLVKNLTIIYWLAICLYDSVGKFITNNKKIRLDYFKSPQVVIVCNYIFLSCVYSINYYRNSI